MPRSRRRSRSDTRSSERASTAARIRGNGRSDDQGPIRYAVVGLGHIAQVAVLPAFRNAKRNSVLAALVSDDARKLRELGRRYRVPHLASYEQAGRLFRSGEIDAVYIAVPNTLHAEWTARAARAGLHVLCEKPMAMKAAECERMIRACRAADVKLMIAYRLHFERATLEVAKLVREGRLGEPRFFNSQFSFQVKEGNIRARRETGGGPLHDIGIYCLNGARMAFAAEPVQVWAAATNTGDPRFEGVHETVTTVLQFPQDRVATFTCSFASADRSRYEIVGTKGNIVVEPAYEYAEGLAYELTIGGKTRKKRFRKSDQFAPELLYFSDCVLNDREPEPSGQEGLTDVRILEALLRSTRTGRWASLARRVRQRRRRPTLRQEIRRPGITKPETIHVQSPHH